MLSYILLYSGLYDGEPGVEPLLGVVVGVNACIISGEMLHLVEAMLGWIGIRLVAEVPLTRKIRRVSVLLNKLRNGRRLLPQAVLVAWSHDDRERGPDRQPSGQEGSA